MITQQNSLPGNVLHLPIYYELLTDAFPTNNETSDKSVLTFSNDNGYTRIKFSSNITGDGTAANTLEFVKGSVNSVSGVYQIYNKYADDDYTIDLEYDGGNVFGSDWNFYFADYHVIYKVYANNTLLSTVKASPDSNNLIKFNINKILKSAIDILGNTIPTATTYDTDRFLEYYITVAESYTRSTDGYTLYDYETNYTTFNGGYAYNAKLPFKEYYTQGSGVIMPRNEFLTLFNEPNLYIGYVYDISFINQTSSKQLVIDRFNGVTLLSQTAVPIVTNEFCRYPLQRVSTEDSIEVYFREDLSVSDSFFISNQDDPNYGSAEASWTIPLIGIVLTGNQTVTLDGSNLRSKFLKVNTTYFAIPPAGTYTLNATASETISSSTVTVYFVSLDDSFNILNSQDISAILPNISTDITIAEGATNIGIYVEHSGDGSGDFELLTFDITYLAETGNKTINVIDECANQSIYITWMNYFGGMDYWLFTAQKEYGIDIEETTQAEKNLFIDWPDSWDGDRVTYETSRKSRETVLVRAENLTLDQLSGLKYIKTSPLVQVVTGTISAPITRNILVDSDSFTLYQDGDKLYSFEFSFRYTDLIPSQSL